MIRERVRPRWSDEDLANIYRQPFDHRALGDGSTARVEVTAWIGRSMAVYTDRPLSSVADLSCGNGEIAHKIAHPAGLRPILGDFAPGYEHRGPIEETIKSLPMVDLFVCAETLEHLWDPEPVLAMIQHKADRLVCSVPVWDDPAKEQNGEHYWAFDREGFETLLADAGWGPVLYAEVPSYPVGGDGGFYTCGIWGCA